MEVISSTDKFEIQKQDDYNYYLIFKRENLGVMVNLTLSELRELFGVIDNTLRKESE